MNFETGGEEKNRPDDGRRETRKDGMALWSIVP